MAFVKLSEGGALFILKMISYLVSSLALNRAQWQIGTRKQPGQGRYSNDSEWDGTSSSSEAVALPGALLLCIICIQNYAPREEEENHSGGGVVLWYSSRVDNFPDFICSRELGIPGPCVNRFLAFQRKKKLRRIIGKSQFFPITCAPEYLIHTTNPISHNRLSQGLRPHNAKSPLKGILNFCTVDDLLFSDKIRRPTNNH